MGEYADMALEEVLDFEDARLDFHTGGMDYSEAYEMGIIDELGYDYDCNGDTHVVCQYCGHRAKRVDGTVIYPHRQDLAHKEFWLCKECDAYVGCHRKTGKPLGNLADSYLRRARQLTHKHLDQIWIGGNIVRSTAYSMLANELGIDKRKCHIGMFSLEECRVAYRAITKIKKRLSVVPA